MPHYLVTEPGIQNQFVRSPTLGLVCSTLEAVEEKHSAVRSASRSQRTSTTLLEFQVKHVEDDQTADLFQASCRYPYFVMQYR